MTHRIMRSALTTLCMFITVTALADPEKWVREVYAPHWEDAASFEVDEAAASYHDPLAWHQADGTFTLVEPGAWITGLVESWRSDGWTATSMSDLRKQQINAYTWTLYVLWDDEYADAAPEQSCSWYLASLIDDEWKITAYAEVDCSGIF